MSIDQNFQSEEMILNKSKYVEYSSDMVTYYDFKSIIIIFSSYLVIH